MKKLRLLMLKNVTDELECPSQDEKHKRIKPQAMNEDAACKERQRKQNRRYSQGMADPIYGMLMAARILCNPLFIRTRFVCAPAEHGDSMIQGPNRGMVVRAG